jgi:hypothetical protein
MKLRLSEAAELLGTSLERTKALVDSGALELTLEGVDRFLQQMGALRKAPQDSHPWIIYLTDAQAEVLLEQGYRMVSVREYQRTRRARLRVMEMLRGNRV